MDDPPGDSDGPGTYSPPTDADLRGADFDLRRFVARVEGDQVVLEVTLGEVIRAPGSAWRSTYTPAALGNGLYLQNIDIYVDTDPDAAGVSTCIPGRRVAFADGRTWKRAIVLTPQPAPVRAIIEGALGAAARRVLVPGPLTTRGKTVTLKVPVAFFDAKPSPGWGWSVQVSGAAWERNFQLADQLRGTSTADALTMPISTTAERWAFGGAPLGRTHPQVVDVLLPPGADQRAVLSGFDETTGALARVPFVYGRPPPAAAEPVALAPPSLLPRPAGPPGWRVVDVAGELVSIQGPTARVSGMMFGQVLDASGAVVARVVVTQVLPQGIVASVVEHRERVARGAQVRFELPKE